MVSIEGGRDRAGSGRGADDAPLFLMTSSSGLGLFSHKLTVHTYFGELGGG